VTALPVRINNCMNNFLASVRVKGQTVKTMVFADSSLHARLILECQFGIGSVVSNPTQSLKANEDYTPLDEVIGTIKSIKPMNPQQAKLDSLKKQKEVASNNLKAERNRQKVAKAQQQIRMATKQKPIA
jgi:hypothetical protein